MKLLRFLLLLFVLVFPTSAFAQENKLEQPPDMPLAIQPSALKLPDLAEDMVVEDHGWLRIAYPKGTEERIEPFVTGADEFKAMLGDAFGQDVLADKIEIRVARTSDAMAALAPPSLPPYPWAVAVTYAPIRLVVVSLIEPKSHEGTDVPETLRHELTHVALADAVAGHHVPLWFNEGLAIHFSGEKAFDRTQALWNASLSKSLLPLSDIDAAYPREGYEVNVAYAEAADFTRFLLREPDKERFSGLIARVRDGGAFDRAIADAYGTDIRRLEFEWREGLSKRFTIWPALAGGSLIWVLGIGLLVFAWVRRRRRAQATLEKWAKEEAAADAAVVAATTVEPDVPRTSRPSLPRVPVVEHEGSWHTLH